MTAHFLEGHARCLALRESEISNFQEKVSMMLTILIGFCNNSSSKPLTQAEISNFQIYFRKLNELKVTMILCTYPERLCKKSISESI